MSTFSDIKYEPKEEITYASCKSSTTASVEIAAQNLKTDLLDTPDPAGDPVIKFIRRVKGIPMLYNHEDANFKNIPIKNQAWKEIAEEFSQEQSWCVKKWKGLRDKLVKRKKLQRMGGPVKPWVYYNEMKFMNFIHEKDEETQSTRRMKTDAAVEDSGEPKKSGRSKRKREYIMSKLPAGYSGPGDGDDYDLYVEGLLEVQTLKDGSRNFLVKWMGYPAYKNTWEPEKNLPPALVKQWDATAKQVERGYFADQRSVAATVKGPCSKNRSFANKLKPTAKAMRNASFPKGWIPEEIKAMSGSDTGLKMMAVTFSGRDQVLAASLEYCKKTIPQLVIQFFENNMTAF